MISGMPITAAMAKQAAAPAIAEAQKNGWNMAVAIVDPAGDLVYFERMDDTQVGSIDIAIAKARSAARFKRPTRVFQEALVAGGAGLRMLALQGAMPIEGGIPLVADGKLIGAIGASGGTALEDGQTAQAGADVFRNR
jgi:uncharacterized protein GlcG (DUF336 family)